MGIRDNIARHMSWSEPSFVKRAERGIRFVPPWFHVIPVALLILFIVIWCFRMRGNEPLWTAILLGLFMGGMSYGIPVINAIGGAMITVSKGGITRMDHPAAMQMPILMLLRTGITEYKWDQIGAILLIEQGEIAGRPLRVLELYTPSHELLTRIGLPPKSPATEKLRACFARNERELAVI